MLGFRSFIALCSVTVCVVIAAVLVSGDSEAIPGSGKPLFPELMSKLNDIREVQVESPSERFVLARSESGWTAPGKFDYPADADKIHKLLVGAAGLNRVEPKTADPARYPKLGLGDPGSESSQAVFYRFKPGGDATLAELIVGNSAPAKGDPDLNEFYVRLPEESRAWLAEGKLPRGDSLLDWLDRKVADIDRSRVRETQVRHASGEVVTVVREASATDDFRLVDTPASKTVDGQWKLNDIGRLFSRLELEDVRPKDEAPIDGEPDFIVTMRTSDGLVVHMEVFRSEQRAFGILEAEFHPPETPVDATPGEKASLPGMEEVRAEVDKLNSRWGRWAYVLPGFKLDALARTHSQLLKDSSEEKSPEQG